MNAKTLIEWITTESRYMHELSTITICDSDMTNVTETFEYFQHIFGGQPNRTPEAGYYAYVYERSEDFYTESFQIDAYEPDFYIALEDDVICFFKIDDII